MAHPILYDIRKVLLSKTVLISMILLIGISFFLISSFSVSVTATNSTNTQILSWYESSGTYHYLVFETNEYGKAVSGVTIQGNLSSSFFSQSTVPTYQGPTVTTNSSGEAQFTIKVPASDINEVNANYTVPVIIHEPNGDVYSAGGQPAIYSPFTTLPNGSSINVPVSPGQIVLVASSSLTGGFSGPITTVTDASNSEQEDLMVTWAGNNGSLPTSYSLYYTFFNETQTCTTGQIGGIGAVSCSSSFSQPSSLSESNTTFFANMTSYEQVFSPPKLEANLGNGSEIGFGLFSSNGFEVTPPVYYSISQLYPVAQTVSSSQADSFVVSFLTTIYGYFIPLIAIVGSYNLYGKDRVSGVLESVLAQPVSRRGLALSRFFSTFAGMAIAIVISMGVVDALGLYYTKSLLNSTILVASAGAFFVELGAFIGIMMVLSRVIKSSGLLIGIGIGLFIIFDFLWSILVLLVLAATRIGINSAAYLGYQIGAEFLNPSQFIQLVITYLTSENSTVGFISPSQYGITIPSLVVTGILWVVVPLAGFLYLAIKRD